MKVLAENMGKDRFMVISHNRVLKSMEENYTGILA